MLRSTKMHSLDEEEEMCGFEVPDLTRRQRCVVNWLTQRTPQWFATLPTMLSKRNTPASCRSPSLWLLSLASRQSGCCSLFPSPSVANFAQKKRSVDTMLRRLCLRLAPNNATLCAVNSLDTVVSSTDLAFQFPQVQLDSHLVDAGLPELRDCKAMYIADKRQNAGRCFDLLQRAQDVFCHLPGWEAQEAMGNTVRSIVASKLLLLTQQRGLNSTLPSVRHSAFLWKQAASALQVSAWTKSDVRQIELGCFLLAKFVEGFSACFPRRDPGSVQADRLIPKEHQVLLTAMLSRADELLKLSEVAVEQLSPDPKARPATGTSDRIASLRWLPVKVTVLKAILTIAHSGNLYAARDLIGKAGQQVQDWGAKRHILHDVTQDPALGLLALMNAEIEARIFNWSQYPEATIDQHVVRLFETACGMYSLRFDTTTVNDGIMKPTVESRSTLTKEQSDDEDLQLRTFYTVCLLSYGNFLLSAPRSSPKEAIFPKGETFTRNAITTVASGSDLIYDDCVQPTPMAIATTRRNAEIALDRALKLNRAMLPDKKCNPLAAWTLLSMGCTFGDLRDYLYATGLLGNSANCFRELYGPVSEEVVFHTKLEERLLDGMGSGDEAATRRNKIAELEASLMSLPDS